MAGTLCILGVDDDPILKDFIRAHVDYLRGEKVIVNHWHPDYKCNGKTIRIFYSTHPKTNRLKKLLPHALYSRMVERQQTDRDSVLDALKAFFRAHQVDVVLAEFGPAGADIAPYLRDLGIPLVVHFHGHDAHRRQLLEEYRDRYKVMFDVAFRFISVSRFMSESLVALGADPGKVVLNPYGPRDDFFAVNPDYTPTAFALGRFTDIKANYLTLAAFAKVAGGNPDARLVMVGGGELLETCKTLAHLWHIEDKVTFTGAIPHAQVKSYFSHACCFVQHSVTPSYGDAEGTPVAILEASAAGLPVVSTRHAGISDVVVHGSTGFLVAERDVDGMAEYLGRLLANPDLSKSMGANARQHVKTSFGLERHIACLQQVLDEAVNRHGLFNH